MAWLTLISGRKVQNCVKTHKFIAAEIGLILMAKVTIEIFRGSESDFAGNFKIYPLWKGRKTAGKAGSTFEINFFF